MRLARVTLVTLLCIVIEIRSEGPRGKVCNGCQSLEGYTRIKRAKYYSSPPQRFYKRPPMSYPIRGPFSYTPPPGYMIENDDQPPPNYRPKVSKRPINDGLGDEDINNIVKYLSKQDLDKIIEFSNEKDRESSKRSKDLSDRSNYITSRPDVKKYDNSAHKDTSREVDNDQSFSLNGPYVTPHEDFRPYNIDYRNPLENGFQESQGSRFNDQEATALFINKNNIQVNTHLESEESMQSQQISYPNGKTLQDAKGNFNTSDAIIFTDSSVMQEEQLPKPSNLREDDFDVSYTNNVPTIVSADSESYKVENFGSLPLMNFHSKLDTVDSYRVPHYTVTSPVSYNAPASSVIINSASVEPAPPASAANDQSDAHLKAIKIWTHKSRGTAYTLHDDGSLSLERPSRPKNNYGYP